MKIIALGGGYCQFNMLKRLKDEGHYIILVDYLEDNPGREFADEHRLDSTFDIDAVTQLILDTKVEAIITMGTDQPVLTAAVAAEKAGLPFYVDSKTAAAVTNKRIMKCRFVEAGIPSAEHRFIGRDFTAKDIEGINFPAVMKPLDSQGQRGIFKVPDSEEIRAHIDETFSYTREDRVLLEEYYPNDEITVSGWVSEGNAAIISVVDRVTMENDNRIGICIAHNYPSRHFNDYKDEIRKLTQKIVDAFGIKNGPLYFQYLIGKEGVKVNEIAMRIGGAYEDIAIPLYSGIDLLGMVIDNCLGRQTDFTKLNKYDINSNEKSMSNQLFFIKPGTIASMTPRDSIMATEGIKTLSYHIKSGNKIGGIKNATARAGYFIVEGFNYEDAMKKVCSVFDHLEILDENGNNMVMSYSEYMGKYKFI